jgi:hypothetical protein
METLMLVNPRRRGKRSRALSGGGGFIRSLTPSLNNMKPMLIGAFQGAAGALAVNAALRFIPLPAILVTGRTIYLTRAALAIGIGMIAQNFLGGKMAVRMAEGALTVVAVDALRDIVLTTTGVNLGYYSPARIVGSRATTGSGAAMRQNGNGVAGVGKYLSSVSGTGKYLSGGASRMAVNSGYGMPGYGG